MVQWLSNVMNDPCPSHLPSLSSSECVVSFSHGYKTAATAPSTTHLKDNQKGRGRAFFLSLSLSLFLSPSTHSRQGNLSQKPSNRLSHNSDWPELSHMPVLD